MINAINPNMIIADTSLKKTLPVEGTGFTDFLKTDMKEFLGKARQVEGLLTNYANGVGDIEEVAPKFKELMLEFEVKTKIIASLGNVIKSLTSMNI
jgi:hypothetical protein